MLNLHWRTFLAVIIFVAGSFSVGTYYGRDVISLAYGEIVGPAGTEPSRFWYRGSNNKKILVFIHGVTGTPNGTWTYQDNNTKTFWPDLMKTDLKDYDIFLLSYYTPFAESGPSIGQIAENMYKDLEQNFILPDRSQSLDKKNRDANYSKLKYKEVIFIAHSMGNLIIRTMMIDNPLPDDSPVQIPLILSLASPSMGSELAELGDKLTVNATYREMIRSEKNSFLQLLNKVWNTSPFDTEIACAYEEKPDPGIGRIVVEVSSATAVCTRPNPRGFQEDHISIVKPKDRNSPVHTWALEEITKPHKKEQWALDRWQKSQIIVGGKDYPESNLHAAMITLVLRDLRDPRLDVTFNYDTGTANSLFSSLVNQDIDIYPEYDGSLLYEYLHRPLEGRLQDRLQGIGPRSPEYDDVIDNELRTTTLSVRYLSNFGFNNPYVLVMSRADANRLGLIDGGKVTISGLRARETDLDLATDQTFTYRSEWSYVTKKYDGLTFNDVLLARHADVYKRIRESRPDNKGVVAVGFGTDSELNPIADDLIVVEDDRKAFPSYYAGSLVNKLLLRKFPTIREALSRLKGILSSQDMADLLKKHDQVTSNLKSAADKKQAVENIAREFLQSKGVLANP
jgi:glycine betaine/choline ABC-type transport system substrate-binding protein